jgi:DNA-binding NarL/FixJ family response regulator
MLTSCYRLDIGIFMRRLTLVLADDDPDFLEELQDALVWLALPGFSFTQVAVVHTGADALEAIFSHQPDLAFLDFDMPEMTGLEVAGVLAPWGFKTRMVLCSGYEDRTTLPELLDARVRGYLLKSQMDNLETALRTILLEDGVYFDPRVFHKSYQRSLPTTTPVDTWPELTPFQLRLLKLLAEGHTQQHIAMALNGNINTIKTQINRLRKALHCKDIHALRFMAHRLYAYRHPLGDRQNRG